MDHLIQRLNEITARLIAEEKVLKRDDRTVLACHGKLDGLETLFFGARLHADSPRDRTSHSRTAGNVTSSDDDDDENANGQQLTSRPSASDQTSICPTSVQQQQQEELARRISKAAHELRNSHEELKVRTLISPNAGPNDEGAKIQAQHIHDLAIVQAGRAAHRILSLEAEVQELECDLRASQASHTFLKLQLKALEVQALRYIPADDDEGLVEGFQQWKKDWSDLDRRARATKTVVSG